MPLTARNIVADALADLNIVAAGDDPTGDDAGFVLGILNRMLDQWNATRAAVYASQFVTSTLTPSLSPHLIGPTGSTSFVVTQRPVSIEGATLILTGTGTPDTPIDTDHDAAWWLNQRVKGLTSAYPTDLYYEPAWPNGKLFFWPVPTAAKSVVLQTRILLTALLLTDTFSLPPGYQEALTLTLEERIAGPFEQTVSPELKDAARHARAIVFGNNTTVPVLQTRDAGMPGGGRSRGTYLTGWR